MKLYEILNATAVSKDKPISPWAVLASLKTPPKIAYRLLKYGAKLTAEFNLIEKHRTKLIYESAGVAEGSEVELKPDTPEFTKFIQSFDEFLSGDSDLEPVGMSMDDLIDTLDAEKGNVLSEQDLMRLEPFFAEIKPDLKLVKEQ